MWVRKTGFCPFSPEILFTTSYFLLKGIKGGRFYLLYSLAFIRFSFPHEYLSPFILNLVLHIFSVVAVPPFLFIESEDGTPLSWSFSLLFSRKKTCSPCFTSSSSAQTRILTWIWRRVSWRSLWFYEDTMLLSVSVGILWSSCSDNSVSH